jgi:hypothetical protein
MRISLDAEEETLSSIKEKVYKKISDIFSKNEVSVCIRIFMDELQEEFRKNNAFLCIKNLGTFFCKEGYDKNKPKRMYFICSSRFKTILKKRFVRFSQDSPQKKYPKKARRAKKFQKKSQTS